MTKPTQGLCHEELGYSAFAIEQQRSLKETNPEMSIEDLHAHLNKKWIAISAQEKERYVKATQSTVRTVFVALIVDLFAFTLILPLFPRLLNYYRHNEEQGLVLNYASQLLEYFKQVTHRHAGSDKWDTVLLGGLVGSLFSLLQFIVSPIIGRASDRLGRRTVLLYTMIGNLLSTLIWLFAHSFNWFLLARVIGGLSEGNVQLSTAVISDITAPEQRSKSLALVGIAFATAFTLGPPMGAWFASIDLSTYPSLIQFGIYPYSMAAFIGLALLMAETLYLYKKLPETLQRRVESPSVKLNTLNHIMGLFSFIFSGMEFTLVFLTFDVLDFSHMQQGKLLSYMGVASALIQGGYVRRCVQKGEKRMVLQGMIMCILGFYCLASTAESSHPMVWLYTGVTCLAFTSGTVVSGLTALASLESGKGKKLGQFRSYGQLGRALGPMSACTVYWMWGPATCYALGSLVMLATTWIAAIGLPNKKKIRKTE
ncbi:major facilitator superfamily domain-containing protein [Sporodiniella umbellata]|nr:major facilitator superfamily domain-containing protein [Sporodiniella umbellata]